MEKIIGYFKDYKTTYINGITQVSLFDTVIQGQDYFKNNKGKLYVAYIEDGVFYIGEYLRITEGHMIVFTTNLFKVDVIN